MSRVPLIMETNVLVVVELVEYRLQLTLHEL